MIGSITTGAWDATRNMAEAMASPFRDPVIRLGVTGLSRAGKTVFITSLVANLMDRGRMPQLRAAAEGRILAAWLQPQPDDAVARFAYEEHLAALTAPEPHWPEGTRRVSQLRLSLRLAPEGAPGRAFGAHGRCISTSWTTPANGCSTSASSTQDFADWSARRARQGARRGRGPRRSWRGSRRPTPPRRSTRWRSRGWPRPTPPTCARRGTRAFRTARRGASCCPATWRARPR